MNSRFSDFIRNASPEERAAVYGKVMEQASIRQRMLVHGCKKSAICNMDYKRGDTPGELVDYVNRLCTTCYQHWAGPVGAVKEYTRAEWDAWMATAFDEDIKDAKGAKCLKK